MAQEHCKCESLGTMPEQPPSFFSRFGIRIREFFVQDLPAELQACESCPETNCTQARWETCAGRLYTASQIEQSEE